MYFYYYFTNIIILQDEETVKEMMVMYYNIFYEMKQYISLYPEKKESVTLLDLKMVGNQRDILQEEGGYDDGNIDGSGIICGDYSGVLF